jgi:hypothetical protein
VGNHSHRIYFSGLCFATALGAIAAKSKRSASPYSTNLLVLILFIIRLSQLLSLGTTNVLIFYSFSTMRFLSGIRIDYASMEFWLGTLVLIGFSCDGQWPKRNKMVTLGPGGGCRRRSTQMVARRAKPITPDESSKQTVDAICLKGEDCGITSHLKN